MSHPPPLLQDRYRLAEHIGKGVIYVPGWVIWQTGVFHCPQDVFVHTQDEGFRPTGIIPTFLHQLTSFGFDISPELFTL